MNTLIDPDHEEFKVDAPVKVRVTFTLEGKKKLKDAFADLKMESTIIIEKKITSPDKDTIEIHKFDREKY